MTCPSNIARIPMDPSHADDQRLSPTPAPLDGPAGDLGFPAANRMGPEAADKSAQTSSVASYSLSSGGNCDSDCLASLSSGYDKSDCLLFDSELAPKDDRRSVYSYFSPSEPMLPLLGHDLISQQSECQFYMKEAEKTVLSSASVSDSSLLGSLMCRSDSLESDTATAPLSDLYISEGETQDFRLSHDTETRCPENETWGTEADPESKSHDSVHDAPTVVTQRHPMLDYESGVRQQETPRPPAVDACEAGWVSVNDARSVTAEVTDLTPHLKRSDSPMELWIDACQYLDMDNAGHSGITGGPTATGDLSFPTTETLVSGYNPDRGNGIGWCDDDTVGWGPPVERWSSVDSWASALSDWTGIITSPPEDLTAAFTEIGAEIDALTQALAEVATHIETEAAAQTPMGVQDHSLKAQNISESSVLPGQICLSLCREAGERELSGGDSSKRWGLADNATSSTPRGEDPEEVQSSQANLPSLPPHWCSSMGTSGTDVSPGGSHGKLVPGSTSSDMDAPRFGSRVESVEADVFILNEEDPILLNIIEDLDLEGLHEPTVPTTEELSTDGLREVTDEDNRTISQLDSEAEHKAKRSVAPADRGGQESSTGHLLPTQTPTDSHGSDVKEQPGLDANVTTIAQSGSAGFVSPLAPLGVGDENTDNDDENTRDSEKSSPRGQHSSDSRECLTIEDIHHLSRELPKAVAVPSDRFFFSESNRVAIITLDLKDPFVPRVEKAELQFHRNKEKTGKMPHKTHKSTSEGRTRSKKDKSVGHHHGGQSQSCHHASVQTGSKKQDPHPPTKETQTRDDGAARPEETEAKRVIETAEETEKGPAKPHSKKKKQGVKVAAEPSSEGRTEMFEAKLDIKAANAQKDADCSHVVALASQLPEANAKPQPPRTDKPPKGFSSPLSDDVKRRRLSDDKFGKIFSVFESKLSKPEVPVQLKGEEPKAAGAPLKKAYSEVVKQKAPPKEATATSLEPKMVKSIQVEAVGGDPQSLSLWCQFSAVFSQHTVTWSRDGTILTEVKRSAGDESRASLIVSNASHKHLGKYQCRLSSPHGCVALDYLLTYEVLSEIVIPPSKKVSTAPVEVTSEEEDVRCSRLEFKEDFLSNQYFGDNLPVSIITEKVHFGEGMHRRAFRTKLNAGQMSPLLPGHSCVLKVHNAISYGTNNNEELIQKNFSLAVEECQVQNTAREYIKAYSSAAQELEAFGEIPEIIPIYLVHRPSNHIPYATLEEELIGDFVKYSVKDGKEINLMRRDSEAGQKCCAFQHWVYHQTDGNLLVTDMQGVGMRLTDVGIATSKKGYKGFKGNCSTSFIDQFKALHQCNQYCEILGLKSLQAKAKKHPSALKGKPQPTATPKKKAFSPPTKGKS
ncbi:alpha-protein kinase 2 [Antennarius striatus]|uniref:alpha-protein kinase 2 n=1 Tax=Antennarius striatus TaxID=241820 RepID=UPI0035B46CFD